MTPRNPLPIGFPLLPTPDRHGRLDWPDLDRSIRNQLRVLLETRPGEQLMRPDFGAGLQQFFGRQDNMETRRQIREVVTGAIARFEDRIDLVAVEIAEDDAPGSLRVELHYRIRRDGTVRTLGVSLALENG